MIWDDGLKKNLEENEVKITVKEGEIGEVNEDDK